MIRQLNLKGPLVDILQSCGRIAAMKGDLVHGYARLQQSVAICEEQGAHMGYLALYQGEITNSRDLFGETLQLFFSDKNEHWVVFALEGMAGLAVVVGKPEIAAQLVGWVDMMREKLSDTRPP